MDNQSQSSNGLIKKPRKGFQSSHRVYEAGDFPSNLREFEESFFAREHLDGDSHSLESSDEDIMPLSQAPSFRKRSVVIRVPKDVVDLGFQTSDDDHFYHDPNSYFDANAEAKKLISRY